MAMTMNRCSVCGSLLRCMGGRSAHPSNWYCEQCDAENKTSNYSCVKHLSTTLPCSICAMKELQDSTGKTLSNVPAGWKVRKHLMNPNVVEIVISSPDGFHAVLRPAAVPPKLGHITAGSFVDVLYRYFDAVLKEESSDESNIPRSS